MNNKIRKMFSTAMTLALALMVGCTPTHQAENEVVDMAQPPLLEQHPPGPVRRHEAVADRLVAVSPAVAAEMTQWHSGRDALGPLRQADRLVNRENYAHFDDNPIRRASEQPVSTFSIDVDTAAYANLRRMLQAGHLPPRDAVRVEEMINYFGYDYPAPEAGGAPFSVHVEQAITPWNASTRLVQIGIKGYQPQAAAIPAANLVFLIDVSGSMAPVNRLPMMIQAMKMLVRELGPEDRVAIVVYASASGVVLESTPGNQQARINAALDQLQAGGSTNGGAGIQAAYAQAEQAFIEGGINRVILVTDGDFNVGTVNFQALVDLARSRRESGIALTTLGVGSGNYNDHLMEQLAAGSNGNYHYIDTLSEARKVLVDERQATLMTIANDVKIQLEFNPAVVAEYRLIGYENRMLAREDFNNDQVDAGDIGAGHTVTALYEVALVGSGGERIDPLRYGSDQPPMTGNREELGFLRLRYKQPGSARSQLIETPIPAINGSELSVASSERLGFAAAVAAFGQYLRGGDQLEGFGLDRIHALASQSRGPDPFGYRGEFLQLLRLADSLGVVQRD
jgi:Ca-activated chloride channel homolog